MPKDVTEFLSELFLDSFLSHLILPLQGELVLKALLGFGGYDAMHIFMAATIAGFLASTANYLFGYVFMAVLMIDKSIKEKVNNDKKFKQLSNVFIAIALFSSLSPLGAVGIFLAGLFRAKMALCLIAVLISHSVRYGMLLF